MTVPDIYLTGVVNEAGKLTLETDVVSDVQLSSLAGERVEIRVRKLTPRRSLAANNFYWGVLIPLLCDYTGETKDEQHKVLKAHFAGEPHFIINEKTGEVIEEKIDASTATMTKARFAEYIDSCIMLCTSLGIQLPFYEGDRYAYAEPD